MKFKHRIADKDFTQSDLPRTRKELFTFQFKNSRRELFYIGIALLVSFLPIIIGFSLYSVLNNVLYQEYMSKASQVTGDELAALTASYRNSYVNYTDIFAWAMIPGLALTALGLSAVFTLMRDYAYLEPHFFKESVTKGIKQNYVQFLIIFLIFGLINVFSSHIFVLNINQYVKIIPIAFEYLVVLPICLLMCLLSCIYKEKLFMIFAMAVKIYFGKIYKTFGLSVMVLVPLGLLVVPHVASFMSIAICYPVLALLLLGVEPLLLFVYFLNMYNIFDKVINEKNYPKLVNKGLNNGGSVNK